MARNNYFDPTRSWTDGGDRSSGPARQTWSHRGFGAALARLGFIESCQGFSPSRRIGASGISQEAMWIPRRVLLLLALSILVARAAEAALDCTSPFTYKGQTRYFGACNTLTGPAALAWTYDPADSTLKVAFLGQAASPMGWVGWGINLGSRPVMVGTNALIGFRTQDRSYVDTYKLTTDIQAGAQLTPGTLDISVLDKAVEITGTTVTIFATIQLRPNQTKINHVWNRGSKTIGVSPLQHGLSPEDRSGVGVIDLSTRSVINTEPPHQSLKQSHGALNAVGWGIFLPLGMMTARYARPFSEKVWFYVHISLQSLGLLLGSIGWLIGLRLGSYSKGIVHDVHRNIGIAIFSFACLQVFGVAFRPNKEHKLRLYWNAYHHSIGYLMLILIFTNIYKGFEILQPKRRWHNAYTGFVVLAAIVSFILEILTWIIYFKRKKNAEKEALANGGKVQMGSSFSSFPA
ncbi:cytochrome b561 and DOMON domain-containing protein At5g35735 [Selaginella moellendorffii]|nr:cytochrome b561 and DOMON domain-containing protein At5g35735 [Selaginella moellendorffii]|eukprot:XP_002974317.2 cytochrome b561 and DOMON domain-containing protein At5g35735 [Selaginella moellendorffii]